MMIDDDDLLKEFVNESREHLATIEADLLTIEEGGADIDEQLVNKVFRAAHSIKRGSGFIGLERVKELAHKAETVLDMLRSRKIAPNAEVTNILLAAFDKLREMINDTAGSAEADIADLVVSLTGLASSFLPPEQKATLRTQVTLEGPADLGRVTIPQTDLDRARRQGQYVYWVDCDLIHDIEQQGQSILTLFKELSSAGEVLDCTVDYGAGGTLDDPFGNRLPLRLVLATDLAPDLVGNLFATIAPERIHLLVNPSEHSPEACGAVTPLPETAFSPAAAPEAQPRPEAIAAAPGTAAPAVKATPR
jgi:two-component system chemotaxis sensor kinase CheA